MVEAFLDRAAQEPGALVLQGEPGIGKTSLWREARGRAVVRGFRVLDCRPAEAESVLSFSGLTDLLEDVPAAGFGSLPEPQRRALSAALLRVSVAEAPDPRSVAAGFRSFLTGLADASPVLVAVDDAQWLDASSASVLAFALRRLEGLRVGFLGAWRPGRQGALDGVLASPYCRLLPLEPFSLAAIHNLLKQRLGRTFPRRLLLALYEACGGNPFYALEIARELAAHDLRAGDPLPVPADLGSLVRRRVTRLPAAARNVLLATVAVAQPTRALVAAAVGAGASAGLEEAERAGFLEVVGERLRFSHPLYGAAVMAAAPAERRRRLHGRMAELIEVEEERARQLALATDAPAEEAAAAVERAGEHVRTRGAAAAAATLFLEAVRLTPAADQVGRQRRTLAAAGDKQTAISENWTYWSDGVGELHPYCPERFNPRVPPWDDPEGDRREVRYRLLKTYHGPQKPSQSGEQVTQHRYFVPLWHRHFRADRFVGSSAAPPPKPCRPCRGPGRAGPASG
jgi:AAA ATPase domain